MAFEQFNKLAMSPHAVKSRMQATMGAVNCKAIATKRRRSDDRGEKTAADRYIVFVLY